MVRYAFSLLLSRIKKRPPLQEDLKFPKLQGKRETNHSLSLPPAKKKIAPIPTLINPRTSKRVKTFSSISLEIFNTKDATIKPTLKLLKTSAQYLKAFPIKGILKEGVRW